jgi:hypothetical protein
MITDQIWRRTAPGAVDTARLVTQDTAIDVIALFDRGTVVDTVELAHGHGARLLRAFGFEPPAGVHLNEG